MNIHQILKKYWGYDSFRPLQEDIINSILSGRDTLGLMPTGGGKSITFQVPSLTFESGVTIVITPLISLMKDQVDNLRRHHIKAVYFHSGMSQHETSLAWEKIINGNARFLYIAPERIANSRFILELRHIKINLIAVDEAHCISQWGYDFRPSYLNIKSLRNITPGTPVLALTATATPEVASDIMRQLGFSDQNIFRKSFARHNISYIVRPSSTKINDVIHILSRTAGSSIVYARSRKRCREIADILNSADIMATYYHAGLEFEIKNQRQNDWQSGKIRVMVATNAFGMGIDKPDVRVVIHYDLPPSLEEYYQEAGRAGRDGENSFAVLLASKNDPGIMRRRISEAFPERKFIKKTYERICNFLHISIGEGYETLKEFNIDKFCRIFEIQEKQCRSALRLLSQASYLQFIEDPDSRSRIKILCTREELYDFHDLSSQTERVLSAILRLYTGLFSDYVYIRESEIAYRVQLQEQQIYEAALELSKHKIISYIPHSGLPMIYFPTAREETGSLLIGKNIYEQRRKIMENRIEAMLDYTFKSSGCRVERMLAYFGEPNSKECQKCDICRQKKKQDTPTTTEMAGKILSFMSIRPFGTTIKILEQICGHDSKNIAAALSFLCNEGFIYYKDSAYYINDSHHN